MNASPLRLIPSIRAVVVFAIVCVASARSYANAWNLQDDYSITSNPNGDWSFGWKQWGIGTLHLYNQTYDVQDFGALFSNLAWHDSSIQSSDNSPMIWKNGTAGTEYGVAPGEVSIHPGPSGQFSVVRWTSPLTGTVTIDATFGAGDEGRMDYFVWAGEFSLLWNSGLTYGSGSFNSSLSVTVGDTIDFMVGEGYGSGNTPLDLTITSGVPDTVSTLGLVALALAGCVLLRRKLN